MRAQTKKARFLPRQRLNRCEICNLGCVGWNRHLLVACTYLIKVGGLAFKYCNQITIKQDKASVGWWSTCALTATGAKLARICIHDDGEHVWSYFKVGFRHVCFDLHFYICFCNINQNYTVIPFDPGFSLNKGPFGANKFGTPQETSGTLNQSAVQHWGGGDPCAAQGAMEGQSLRGNWWCTLLRCKTHFLKIY